MIQIVRLKNFKCFEDQIFAVGNLTLLAGLNGMGKSTVLQALLLLRQSKQESLLDSVGLSLNADLVQLGTAQDIFFEGAASDDFGFILETRSGLNASWSFKYDREADVASLISNPVPEEIYTESLFTDQFHYLQAERIGPRVTFSMSDYLVRQHQQIGPRGEFTIHFLSLFGGENIISEKIAHKKSDTMSLLRQTEAWMSEISPGLRIELTTYADLDLINLRYSFVSGSQVSNSFRSTNVGFGITYTLPIVVALLSSSPDSLILLENPEAHLHPQGQFKIGELIARSSSCGLQVIVETHSDHVLNGIRVAVHDGVISPDKVKLYFLARKDDAYPAGADVIAPNIDQDGRIDQWPEGFFDEWDKSLERLLKPAEN